MKVPICPANAPYTPNHSVKAKYRAAGIQNPDPPGIPGSGIIIIENRAAVAQTPPNSPEMTASL
ncbi:MAG: hypothetical protein QXO15_11755, partial [Nitrososphaerota archaeon]